jgi:hypothetical protein
MAIAVCTRVSIPLFQENLEVLNNSLLCRACPCNLRERDPYRVCCNLGATAEITAANHNCHFSATTNYICDFELLHRLATIGINTDAFFATKILHQII